MGTVSKTKKNTKIKTNDKRERLRLRDIGNSVKDKEKYKDKDK